MKLFFLSDIHGSFYFVKEALKCFENEDADKLVILGDVLYHGPRNPLTKDYNPKEVAELLNKYKSKIIAVRGNCDSEVDQVVLDFPMMSDYNIILMEKYKIFLTHGHIFNVNKLPELNEGDIFINGHFHIPKAEKINGIYCLNPGSISLPRENYPESYGILEDNIFYIKSLSGEIINKIEIK